MRKKKLLVLPVIAVVLTAFFGFTVMASDSGDPINTGFKVFQNNGANGNSDDVTLHFDCNEYTEDVDITKDNNLQSKINEIDKNLKPSDFKTKVTSMDISPIDEDTGTGPWKVILTTPVNSDEIGLIAHQKKDGSVICRVFKGNGKNTCAYIEGIKDFDSFILYTVKATEETKTIDYPAAYVLLFSLALMSCGMFFTIRAMRSTKV